MKNVIRFAIVAVVLTLGSLGLMADKGATIETIGCGCGCVQCTGCDNCPNC